MAKRILLIALAALGLAGCSDPAVDATKAWQAVCAVTETDCSEFEPPVVVYERGLYDQGIWGYYSYMDGTNEVHVERDLRNKPEAVLVIVHEMTHYLQAQIDGHGAVPRSVGCMREEEAFAVEHAVAEALGMEDSELHAHWEDIAWQYRCENVRLRVGII